MPLNRRSKVKEVWAHPVGHNLLCAMLRQVGKTQRWLKSPPVANMPLHRLDRLAGAGFADMVVEMASRQPDMPGRGAAVDAAWWKEGVFYQVFLPSFMDSDHDGMGDVAGVTRRLPYLQKLGITVIWLWRVNERDYRRGGGAVDYRSVQRELGNMEDLRELVRQAHARGMRVMMGLGISATSDAHPWFEAALEGDGRKFYVLRSAAPGTPPPTNWASANGGPMWSYFSRAGVWALHTNGAHLMDLDWDTPAVRSEMADVLKFWKEVGMDGFCLDGVAIISKSAVEDGCPTAKVSAVRGLEKIAFGPHMHKYLQELREKSGTEHLLLMGETPGVETEMAKMFCGCGCAELDMVMDTSHFQQRSLGRTEKWPLSLLELRQYYLHWMEEYGGNCWMPLFLENPEMGRSVSRFGVSPVYRVLLAKLLATMLFTLRGTPVVYQGQELGIPNTRFASSEELYHPASRGAFEALKSELGEAAALKKVLQSAPEHARTPMPWNASVHAGFSGARPWTRLPDGADHLNAELQMADAGSVWNHYRRLIELHKAYPCLVYGSINHVFTKKSKLFCYFRILDGHKWYVEMNLTEREVARPARIAGNQRLMLSNYDTPFSALRPLEANLYRCE